jgi:hypothetical protein
VNIGGAALLDEYIRAALDWPFIDTITMQHALPRLFLYAVGSRETNLRNVVGDGGHGHGVWQLDDRSHNIPPGFDSDVRAQAFMAAGMLAHLYATYGDWQQAANAYNSGSPLTSHTTGGDYGPDVISRLLFLQNTIPPDRRHKESDMPYRFDPTPIPADRKRGDLPDVNWTADEHTLALSGPAGGWSGRTLAHNVFGYGGACIQEAWWGFADRTPVHTVDPAHPFSVAQFVPVIWEAPTDARFLTIRLATASVGSVAFETEH